MMKTLLAINSGTSSLKFKVVEINESADAVDCRQTAVLLCWAPNTADHTRGREP